MKFMNVGRKLKELREKKNLTQEKVSNDLNINRVQYCQYENDYFNVPIKHLINIAQYYQVSIDYLFDLTNEAEDHYKNIADIKIAGNRLKEFRKENKLTQSKLASILNTTQSVIADYERGRYLIATPFLYTICSKYHISADYLLGKIDDPKYYS